MGLNSRKPLAKKVAKSKNQPMATPITSALDFLRIKKEIAAHIELIAEDCGMFDNLCEKDEKVFAIFIENIIAFKTAAVLELLGREKARFISNIGRDDLTERQAAIIDEVVEGKTNKEIAADLGYATSTIQHEITSILAHFRLRDREHLITYSLAAGREAVKIASPPPK